MSKITILSEFKIIDDKRDIFLSLLEDLTNNLRELGAEGEISVFEGVDQPGLFVEEFILKDKEAYDQMKKVRDSESSPFWQEYNTCILGGKTKLNIWAFEKMKF